MEELHHAHIEFVDIVQQHFLYLFDQVHAVRQRAETLRSQSRQLRDQFRQLREQRRRILEQRK